MYSYHPIQSQETLLLMRSPAAAALGCSRLVDAALCVSSGPALDASASSAFTDATWLVRSCLLLTSRLQGEAFTDSASMPGLSRHRIVGSTRCMHRMQIKGNTLTRAAYWHEHC